MLASLVYVILFLVAIQMAEDRNRDVFGCILSNIFFSPLFSIIILLLLGRAR
jgi:hypothetical protein